MSLQEFDTITATFRPIRVDDLQPGNAEWIGFRGRWLASWKIEDGPYEGQWAFTSREPEARCIGWVPECDLAEPEAQP